MLEKINYHIHTTHSDGALSVDDMVNFLAENNVTSFSITDHDEIEGNYLAKKLAVSLDMNYINGIELSCCFDREEGFNTANICHILGYGFNLELMSVELARLKLFKQASMVRLGRQLYKDGYDIPLQDSRFRYAEALCLYGYVPSIIDGFTSILNCSDYLCLSRNLPYIKDGIEIIKKCGGKAFWAHPYEIVNGKKQRLSLEVVQNLTIVFKSYGLDGLETYYSYFGDDEINDLVALANSNNLLKSVGTDFHGKAGRNTPIRSLAFFNRETLTVNDDMHCFITD